MSADPSRVLVRKVQRGRPASLPRMKTPLVLVALLALAAFPAPASAVGEVGKCVNYMYVADYQWYYVCVDTRSASCPVYTIRSNGASWFDKQCLTPRLGDVSAPPRCVQWGQDLDYSHYVCYDLGSPTCAVYLLTTSGSYQHKTCIPGLFAPAADVKELDVGEIGGCVNWANDLEYAYWVCVKPFDPDCQVFVGRTGGYPPQPCA